MESVHEVALLACGLHVALQVQRDAPLSPAGGGGSTGHAGAATGPAAAPVSSPFAAAGASGSYPAGDPTALHALGPHQGFGGGGAEGVAAAAAAAAARGAGGGRPAAQAPRVHEQGLAQVYAWVSLFLPRRRRLTKP